MENKMNEEIGEVEVVKENAVIETVSDVGEAAVNTISESTTTFVNWIKGFLTWENLFKVIISAIIILLIYFVYRIIVRSIKKVSKEKLSEQKSAALLKLIHYIYYFILARYVLSLFGVKLSAVWGAAGVAGVALAFAAQTSVSNIISGIFIIAEKTMKPGDLITVGSETGIVDIIGLLSVQIHTLDNQLIRIPNSTIINSNMVNTSYFSKRRMTIGVSIAYDTDMEFALKTLNKAPLLCEHVLKEPAPAAWFDKFDESGINMGLAVWFNSSDFLVTKNETFIAIKKVFDEAKIEIPYNKIDVKILEENVSKKSTRKGITAKKTSKTISKK